MRIERPSRSRNPCIKDKSEIRTWQPLSEFHVHRVPPGPRETGVSCVQSLMSQIHSCLGHIRVRVMITAEGRMGWGLGGRKDRGEEGSERAGPVSYTHLRAHETEADL
eukprot:2192539-Rhodomonas_salina.2